MNEETNRIFIPPDNRMSATYSLIGSGYSEVYMEIDTRSVEDSDKVSEIYIRALEHDLRDTEINIMYRGYSGILTEIQPMGFNGIYTEIEIRPGNRMWALYEVQEPPKLVSVQEPTKDAFVRDQDEYRYINYGNSSTLAVGNYRNENYESFVHFNLSNWHPQFMVLNSSIRLHYSGSVPDGTILELFSVDEEWSEYGITYMNRPSYSRLIIDQYENSKERSYIEIEVTEQVKAWINRPDLNYGFVIRASNGTNSGTVNFRSRESSRSPELLITYYDARILSAGRSQTYAELFVWSVGGSEVLSEIEVSSVYGNSNMLTEVYVHRVEVPVESDVDTEIIVTKLKTNSEITISLQDISETLSEISARSEVLSNRIDTEIIVSKPYQFGDIYVKYRDMIDSEITVSKDEFNDILTEICTSRNLIFAEMFVKYKESVDSEITIQHKNIEDIFTEITVSRETLDSEIFIKYQDSVASELSIYGYESDDIYSEISIVRDRIDTDIYVRALGNNEVDTQLYVRVEDQSKVLTEVSSSRDAVLTDIIVTYYENIDTEIFVKYQYNTPSELAVSRPIVHTEIVVPYWDDSIVLSEIRPRILTISQTDTEILVRDGVNAYAYII